MGQSDLSHYRRAYPEVAARVLERLKEAQRIHGSEVRDFFIAYARGRFSVDDHAEKLIRELVAANILSTSYRDPTLSQRAFWGLTRIKNPPWGPGTVEHYWYLKV